jgi:hypothetical protein
MGKFNYDITVEAATEAEADSKMKALTTVAKKLSTKELVKLADIVQNDPIKTALAKKALGV